MQCASAKALIGVGGVPASAIDPSRSINAATNSDNANDETKPDRRLSGIAASIRKEREG